MAVLNDLDRFHLVGDVIDRLPQLGPSAAYIKQALRDKLIEHKEYIRTYGQDLPEVRNWRWGEAIGADKRPRRRQTARSPRRRR
jgi:xylulose-5-phosphate/fructose-6-phosphate phosphoketolase